MGPRVPSAAPPSHPWPEGWVPLPPDDLRKAAHAGRSTPLRPCRSAPPPPTDATTIRARSDEAMRAKCSADRAAHVPPKFSPCPLGFGCLFRAALGVKYARKPSPGLPHTGSANRDLRRLYADCVLEGRLRHRRMPIFACLRVTWREACKTNDGRRTYVGRRTSASTDDRYV